MGFLFLVFCYLAFLSGSAGWTFFWAVMAYLSKETKK